MRDESTPAFIGDSGRRHAAVVGAGIGGLLAGRVLAGYFDRVTILERDVLPYEPASRKGVPHHVSSEMLALAVERKDVARTLLEVKNLLAPPSALLRPGILLPALRRTVLSLLGTRKEPRVKVNSPMSDLISGMIYLVSSELSVPFFCFW
jgi:hypothetical protein